MIYEFKCDSCQDVQERIMTVSEYEKVKDKIKCACGGVYRQLFSLGNIFQRSPFPKNFYYEHLGPNGTKLRDKQHFLDACAEHGWTSQHYDGI